MHRPRALISPPPWLLAAALVACAPKHAYPDGRGLEGQLEREIIALQERARLLEAEAKSCQEGGKTAVLYGLLTQILTAKDVTVTATGPVTRVTLPDSHLFGADEVSIREEAFVTLDLLAQAIQDHPDFTIVIEGHTNDRGPSALTRTTPDLTDVSYARARLVREVLVQRFHVDESRVTLSARGPYAPIATNDTPAGQAQNARVDVLLYPAGMR